MFYTNIGRNGYSVVLADSFVAKNKLRTPENTLKGKPSSGEARLYLGGVNTEANTLFSFNTPITYRNKSYLEANETCFFSKSNLLKYLIQAEEEYFNPKQNYFYDISDNFYEIFNEISSFTEDKLSFNVFHHPGEKDGTRFYINSLSPYWSIFRTLALPHITTLKINKVFNTDNNEYEYYFELALDNKYKSTKGPKFSKVHRWKMSSRLRPNRPITTEYVRQTLARNGQGFYKNQLLETMPKCCFTDLTDVFLLRASHIKPWAISNDFEKLDPYNGLILTPTYDVLFDKGLISFENDGRLIISPKLNQNIADKLGLEENKVYDIYNNHGKRNDYLKFHRDFILKF